MSAPDVRRALPVWPFVVLALVSVTFSVTPIVNAVRKPLLNKDYAIWYRIGLAVRADQPLYGPDESGEILYMYPPTAAVLVFSPLSGLGAVGFVVVLATATALSWFGCTYLAIRLATGRWPGHPDWYYFFVYAMVGAYVYDLFLLGQVNLVLLFLTLLSAVLLQRRRPWRAGLCLGLAIAVKVFPLPVLVYWAVRRQWLAILSAILTVGVAVAVLPGLARGMERNADEVRQWFQMMVGDQSGNTMAARSITGFTRRNQSLVSLSHRLLRDIEASDPEGPFLRVNVADVPPRTAQLVGYAAVCLLGVVLLVATRCRFATTPEAEAQEWAMVCVLVVLSSPLSWTYFYCWLLPAWAVVLHEARARRWVRFAAIPVTGLFLSALTEQFDPRLQAYGVTAWGGVGLYLILARLRWSQVPKMPGSEPLTREDAR
ncbi:glycosyltransferase family 87 protein [Limnoglobus roseus]|uniref:DUF2029 domain-containing protein n=1 Tax=Limnoglobus roseus TaxID=2598579 RepID=A0A5C1ABX2_9BACT|nr:glycosyltransferase family 87 protein [Limnoglobus roseus]QEL16210.1 hypothetical protein PX52LOC_03150 [Limnoglobus roseus]